MTSFRQRGIHFICGCPAAPLKCLADWLVIQRWQTNGGPTSDRLVSNKKIDMHFNSEDFFAM